MGHFCDIVVDIVKKEAQMSNIIESHFGTLMSPKKIAAGAASSVKKRGAFYVFSLRVDADDIREYSFTDRQRAESAREVLISHLEQKVISDAKRTVS